MRIRRVACIAIAFAILWTAMWPLLGAVREVATGDVQPLCHQAGMQVEAGSAPRPEPGEPPKREQHCPLCIMVFFGAHGAAPSVPPLVFGRVLAVAQLEPAALARRFPTVLPHGRAPPTTSRSA